MNIPSNLRYTKDHEWIRVEGEEAYVGITDSLTSTHKAKPSPKTRLSALSRL